jgi:UDP-N-acetylmuramyl pentapeptide phosphotransferase/UDP-N-acetylglucosamine-1-phosphate transferase
VTQTWPLLAVALGDAVALASAVLLLRATLPRLRRTNHRGQLVPAVLGLGLVMAVVVATIVTVALAPRPYQLDQVVAGAILGSLALCLVGLMDDLTEGRARGFRGHLGTTLRRGRPTTGVVKLAVGVVAGIWLAVLMGGGSLRVASAAVVMAVATNVWNALDVVPGRALKAAAIALLPMVWASWSQPASLVVSATLGATVVLLPFDLLERGMLGDAGSNPLGFLAGVGLATTLPTYGLVAAAAIGVLLQLAAETVTISRLVEAAPPLRWLDRLGRRA